MIEPVFFDLEPFPDNEKTTAAGTADLIMEELFVKKGLMHVSGSLEFRIVSGTPCQKLKKRECGIKI